MLKLQAARSYPSVSLLLTMTRPGPEVDRTDAARFDALVDEACTRLGAECLAEADAVADALVRFRGHLAGPVDHAVAVFVSTDVSARVDLPLPVVDRTVVDPTFATRDLVRALHRTPRHVVLLLAADEARLLDGVGGTLAAAPGRFPLSDPDQGPGDPARTRFLVDVDHALGAYRRLRPPHRWSSPPPSRRCRPSSACRATSGASPGRSPATTCPLRPRSCRPVCSRCSSATCCRGRRRRWSC